MLLRRSHWPTYTRLDDRNKRNLHLQETTAEQGESRLYFIVPAVVIKLLWLSVQNLTRDTRKEVMKKTRRQRHVDVTLLGATVSMVERHHRRLQTLVTAAATTATAEQRKYERCE